MNWIEVSMDGKGRWADNIQIERFWRTLKSYASVAEARESIALYIKWYNHERLHTGIEKNRPHDVMTGKVRFAKFCGNVDNAHALTCRAPQIQ